MERPRRRPFEGWPLLGWASLFVAAFVAFALVANGAGEGGLRAAIRATAGASFTLFAAAFAASPWNTLRASPASKWLLRNRRYLGLSFALSQTAHAIFIISLACTHGDSFRARLHMSTVVGGGFGYVLLAAMVATSFDRTARWLGRARWSILHTTGMYVFWIIFATSYGGRHGIRYGAFTAILLALVVLRAAAAWKRARARKTAWKSDAVRS